MLPPPNDPHSPFFVLDSFCVDFKNVVLESPKGLVFKFFFFLFDSLEEVSVFPPALLFARASIFRLSPRKVSVLSCFPPSAFFFVEPFFGVASSFVGLYFPSHISPVGHPIARIFRIFRISLEGAF